MKILAVDASTEACSVALRIDGESRQQFAVEPRRHTELILPMVDALLAEAELSLSELDLIAFDRGPGAFTGVRVGTSVAQGLAFSADLPVAPVSSLAALAQGAWREKGCERVLSLIDARMGELYCGCYVVRDGLVVADGDEQLVVPEQVMLQGEGWHVAGSGWAVAEKELAARLSVSVLSTEPERLPEAQDVAILAEPIYQQGMCVTAEQALPVYLRDEVAWQKQSA